MLSDKTNQTKSPLFINKLKYFISTYATSVALYFRGTIEIAIKIRKKENTLQDLTKQIILDPQT